MSEDQFSVEAVRDHYDRLSGYYRTLWGEHIHHGYWEDGESPARAQVSSSSGSRSARVSRAGGACWMSAAASEARPSGWRGTFAVPCWV